MQISRVTIKNFRNFKDLDVEFGKNIVLLGENGVGKTNFLEALRLVLDPSRERKLYREDFHRSKTPPFQGSTIEVHLYFKGFEDNPILLGRVFSDCIIKSEPPMAQVSYIYRPKPKIDPKEAKGRDDYEAIIYGRGDPSNNVRRKIRPFLDLKVIPALRDIDRDIGVWQSSPLRRLVNLMGLSDHPEFIKVAQGVKGATKTLQSIKPIQDLQKQIKNRLAEMIEGLSILDPRIGMLPTNPEELQRALRLFIDENLSLNRSSLGLANVLYLTLLLLEIEQLEEQRADEEEGEEYRFTILAVEEPEAHLHPHLQRLVFHDFLRHRPPILLSTHSPQIISVAEADSFVLLKEGKDKGSVAASTAKLSQLPEWELDWKYTKRDIERYLDATRGEIVFAKGVILVEGNAELFLIPAFAKAMKQAGIVPYSLDGAGVSVCSVAGTDFVPYVRFLGPDGLDLPLVIVTDGDRYVGLKDAVQTLNKSEDVDGDNLSKVNALCEEEDWESLRNELEELGQGVYEGLKRGIQLAKMLSSERASALEQKYEQCKWTEVQEGLAEIGIFVNEWTLETELVTAGYQEELIAVYSELGASEIQQENMRQQLLDGTQQELHKFIKRIEETGKGKGRFAQRLADKADPNKVPPYIQTAIQHIITAIFPMSNSEDEETEE